ncbi:MAG: patatin-like phospholipase family protein [Chloroflexota bacterium]|nr:patatin-like phospholipase family protein [Chloroflexota bacterium]
MRTLKLGLALGSGGTKGAAHVGVIRVLEEAGIKIDAVAGTSIGALYGGAYAVGRSPQEIDEGIRTCPNIDVINFFRHRLKLRHNNRLARRFYEALAGYRIEDLPIPFATTASDIGAHRSVTITSGPIIDAIEASIAIPMIARPVVHQGRYLLDGGFWGSAPVDAASELGADIVVAVELGHPYTLPPSLQAPASWLAAKMAVVPIARTLAGVPFTISAVSRTIDPGRTADVVIHPVMPRASGNSPYGMVRCLDAGIEAARAALPAIEALLAGESPALVAREFAPAPGIVRDAGLAT